MHITIRKSSDHDERRTIWLPMEEEELEEVCEELGIEITTGPNCYIEDGRDGRFINILADDNVNIDELNYLMKRFDGFDSREIDKFYAVAFAEEYSSMKDLINLSFNLHGYSLVNNFDDFNKLGKELYLTEKMAVASDELERMDGEAYALDVIKNNETARVTPYGVLYKNSNEIDQVYNGKQFPPYGWKDSMATLELKAKDQSEFIYLPSPDIEIEKALMRLGVSYLQDCELHLDSHNLPDKVLKMIPHNDSIVERLDILNRVSDIFLEMDGDVGYFEELMDYIKPSNIDEIFLLAETMYEFETFGKFYYWQRIIREEALIKAGTLALTGQNQFVELKASNPELEFRPNNKGICAILRSNGNEVEVINGADPETLSLILNLIGK